jgi:hypothetical protein
VSNVIYYRLKMVDTDDTFAYSRIQTLRFDCPDIVLYPNPVETGKQLQLLLSDSKVRNVSIYNLAGKLVFESDSPTDRISIQDLPVGRYILRIRLQDGSENSRTFVKR